MTRKSAAHVSTLVLTLMGTLCAASVAAAQDDAGGSGGGTSTTRDSTSTSSGGGSSSTHTQSQSSPSADGSTASESNTRTVFVQQAPAPPPEEDDGHKAVLWLEAGAGASYVDMAALSNDNLYPTLVELKGFGPAAMLAAHVRIAFITAGARVTLASYPGFEVGTAAVEVGIQPATQSVQPYFRFGLGYAWHGDANYDDPNLSHTDVFGYVIQGGLGIEILFSKLLSLGAGLDVDLLNMPRQAVSAGDLVANSTMASLQNPGDAVGLQVRPQVHLSLRF